VTATPATGAWAVGDYNGSQGDGTLIARWNGTAWRKVPSPNPGSLHYDTLAAVAAASATSAWTVGYYQAGLTDLTLIARWNGTSWAKVPSPNPGGTGSADSNLLQALAVTSATSAWAVGSYSRGPTGRTLILHWNGTAWHQTPSP
jgi:hypothetical protein